MYGRIVLTTAAQRRLELLREKYKPKRDQPYTVAPIEELGNVAVGLCRDELARAKEAFEAFRWRESAKLYAGVARSAEAVRTANPVQREVDAVTASALLGQAASLMNLQDTDAAIPLLATIQESALTNRQRCALATALVQTESQVRARMILDGVPTDARHEDDWEEANQVVDLLTSGTLPFVPKSVSVLNFIAQHWLRNNQVEKAGKTALEGLETASKSPLLRASLVAAAMVALLRTIFEDDLADGGVPPAARRSHAGRVAEAFPEAFRAELPEPIRLTLLGVGLNYASSLRERALLRWILQNTDEDLRNRVRSPDGSRAFELAAIGKTAEAMEVLPKPKHPWRFDLQRSELLAIAGDVSGATHELSALAARWPNRVPIHAALAELLTELERHHEAAEHARKAFALFPTDSMADLVASCLVNSRQGAEALAILLDRPASERFAELRAYAAEQAQDAAAPSYWAELLKYRPQSRAASLGLAFALSRTGDAEAAARQARSVATGDIDRLARDELAACGQLLSLARFLPGVDDLIRELAETLRIRFPNDDTAEFQRFSLISALGFPEGVAPIDYARLERGGHLRSASLDDVVDVIAKRRHLAISAHRLYRDGWLSFDSFAELTGLRAANLLVRFSAAAGDARLRAPIQPSLSEVSEDLRGKTVLCSSVELLLLGSCRLLDEIPAAIGDGRLITIRDVWTRMLEDVYFLEQSAQRDEATRLRSLIARLSARKIIGADDDSAERVVASKHGCRYVTGNVTEASDVDVLAILAAVAAAGKLSRTDMLRAARYVGRQSEASVIATTLEGPFLFEAGLLDVLDRAGVLDRILDACEGIVASAYDLGVSRQRLRELDRAGEAAKLQRDVLQRLADGQRAGWFEIIPAPAQPAIPPVRKDIDEERADLLTHSIRALLPLKYLLEQHQDWYRVTADSFGFDSLGHPDQWSALAFAPAEGRDFIARYWKRDERELSLSRFARALAHGPRRANVVRFLARLGFTDVVLPSDIADMAEEFGRLDSGNGADVLAGVESNAGDELARGVFCRTHISMAYAMAIWRMARSSHFDANSGVPGQLLERLDRIDKNQFTRLVEQTLGNLFLCALDDREASFVQADGDVYHLDQSSPAGRLWSALAKWRTDDASHQAAVRRAVADAWETLGELGGEVRDGPKLAQWAPLALINDVLVEGAGVNTEVPSPDAVVAVMSANWEVRPLTRRAVEFTRGGTTIVRTIEDLLDAAATVLNENSEHTSNGTSLTFDFRPDLTAAVVRVSVPFEAAILRAMPVAASRAAVNLSMAIGIFDGRLHRALTRFAAEPHSWTHRKYLSRAACHSPFRLVLDDPQFLLCLGDRASVSPQEYPANLAELREMLSEPPSMLTGTASGVDEQEMPLELARRMADDGFWGKRTDLRALVHFASRVPGRLPAVAARSLVESTDASELRHIVRVLTSSTEHSIGDVALAAALAAYACFNDGEDELRVELVTALSTMLSVESCEAPPASLASVESAAITTVGRVVSRLAVVPVPTVEHAWLTQRLYEWWVRLAPTKDVIAVSRGELVASWHEVRTEVLLNVILDVLEAQVIGLRRRTEPVLGLVPELLKLAASREGNPFEPAQRPPGWLYWRRPQGSGWLAASIALWIDPNSFLDLRREIRLAVLDRLPRSSREAEENGISFASFVPALSRFIAQLTYPETDALRNWLAAAESNTLLDLWRAVVLSGLLAVHGMAADADALHRLMMAGTLAESRVELVAGYLEAVAASENEELHRKVFDLVDVVHGTVDPEAITRGIDLALTRPRANEVRNLLVILDKVASITETLGASPLIAVIRDALARSSP